MSTPIIRWKVFGRRGSGPAVCSAAANRGPGLSRLAWWLVVAGVGALIAGCASESDNAAAVAHGEALAQRSCGSCHGLGLTGASSYPGAPTFRDMHFDYNAISYERSLAKWHLAHVDMPPAELSLDDVSDIGAYVRSLKHPGRGR